MTLPPPATRGRTSSPALGRYGPSHTTLSALTTVLTYARGAAKGEGSVDRSKRGAENRAMGSAERRERWLNAVGDETKAADALCYHTRNISSLS